MFWYDGAMSTRQKVNRHPSISPVYQGNICKDKPLLKQRKKEAHQSKILIETLREIRKVENKRFTTWDKFNAELESAVGAKQERSMIPHRDLPRNIDDLARYLRANCTESESRFFPLLKTLAARHNDSAYFQHVVGRRFVVDFFLPRLKLAIELDGSSHAGKEDRDAKRDQWIYQNAGITVLRYNAYQSIINPSSILRDIDERVEKMARYSQV